MKFLSEMNAWGRDYHYAEYFNQGIEPMDPPTDWHDDDDEFFWRAYEVVADMYADNGKKEPSVGRIRRMIWQRPAILTQFRAQCVKGYQGNP